MVKLLVPVTDKISVTSAEAAALCSVSYEQINLWMKDCDFPALKIGERGGKHLILIADLKEWATRFKSFLSLVLMSYFFLNLSFWWYIGRVLFHVGSLNGTIKKAMSQM